MKYKNLSEYQQHQLNYLTKKMFHEGAERWAEENMEALCDLANLQEEWIKSDSTKSDWKLTRKAARILNVQIEYFPTTDEQSIIWEFNQYPK